MKYTQRKPCPGCYDYMERKKRKAIGFLSGLAISVAGALICLGINYAGNKNSELILESQKPKKTIEKIIDDETLDNLEKNINEEKKEKEMKPVRDYNISNLGIELIMGVEGFKKEAYLCPAGVLTIGYGHTENVKEGDEITREKAIEYLLADLRKVEDAVRRYVTVPLKQNQYDALVSFTYNVGINAFKTSTLLKRLNAGDYDGVGEELMRWVNIRDADGNKRVCQGLVNRRIIEKKRFLGVEE